MKLTSSQDRAAIGRWIEGQADHAEGRRILAALPRLGRGEGWVWAPSDGVLARVAFPRIETFDSSSAPPRVERLPMTAPVPVDLSAIIAALAGYEADDSRADVFVRRDVLVLEQRLQQREQELARALDRIAGLEAALQAE